MTSFSLYGFSWQLSIPTTLTIPIKEHEPLYISIHFIPFLPRYYSINIPLYAFYLHFPSPSPISFHFLTLL